MTDQTKPDPVLPPLPTGLPTYEFPDGAYSGDDMQDYGRACYAQARADLIASMEPMAELLVTYSRCNVTALYAANHLKPGDYTLAIIPEN